MTEQPMEFQNTRNKIQSTQLKIGILTYAVNFSLLITASKWNLGGYYLQQRPISVLHRTDWVDFN